MRRKGHATGQGLKLMLPGCWTIRNSDADKSARWPGMCCMKENFIRHRQQQIGMTGRYRLRNQTSTLASFTPSKPCDTFLQWLAKRQPAFGRGPCSAVRIQLQLMCVFLLLCPHHSNCVSTFYGRCRRVVPLVPLALESIRIIRSWGQRESIPCFLQKILFKGTQK